MLTTTLRQAAMLLASLLLSVSVVHSRQFAAEVYSDDFLRIHSGLGVDNVAALQFGDVVDLIVSVEYDPARVNVLEPGEQFFTNAWPENSGAVLKNYSVVYERQHSAPESLLLATFQFQLLACPDDKATCPDDRNYPIPEFQLQYLPVGEEDSNDGPVDVRFRIWPDSLTVFSGIKRDAENQLMAFEAYFPNGAYPEPLSVEDRSGRWWATTGTAFIGFAGGMFMWLFGERKKINSAAEPRWQSMLKKLREDDQQDEVQLFDDLRRCLVWYCNDALKIDPFTWLDLAETGDPSESDAGHTALRSLFVSLLHNPIGRGAELKTELEQLIYDESAA